MPELPRLLPFFARHRKSVLTFLLFIAYAGAVFWSNYQSLQQVQESTLARFKLEAEKQASVISYFFAERRIEIAELAESESILNFFRNRDLGMSYEYGLGVNIQLIEDRLEYVAGKKRSGKQAVFSGFMLIDSDGSIITDWNAPVQQPEPKGWLKPENREARTQLGSREGTIVIAAPVWIDDIYRGELLAWVDAETSFAQFGGSRDSTTSVLIQRETGAPLLKEAQRPPLDQEFWRTLPAYPPQGSKPLAMSYKQDGNLYHITRLDIDQMPIALVQVSREEATDGGMARLFVIAAAILPFIVLLAGFLDVLERRRLDNLRFVAQAEAERLAQARSDFLANMSHEIRTPMNAIIGMTELCLGANPSPQQRNYLSKIQQTSDLLLRIINDILDFSKIESGKLSIEKHPFDVNQVLDDVGNLLAAKAGKKGIEIIFEIDESCHRGFLGDRLRLEQILINLLGNAIKFSGQGNVIVRARAEKAGDEAIRLSFQVIDEGIGISAEQKTRLFTPFTQADSTTTRLFGGTGLGLAICRQLVELMGGSIEVNSEPGRGSTFNFSLLAGIDPVGEAKLLAMRDSLSRFTGHPVLIIDDNPHCRQAIAAQFAQLEWPCITCATASEATALLSVAEANRYLAILVDLQMPGKNGLDTIRELRATGEASTAPLMFLMTSTPLDADESGQAAPFDGVLSKPTTVTRLYAEMAPFLGIETPADTQRINNESIIDALKGRDILVVDDVTFNQEVVRDMLVNAGMTVRIANDGAEALSAVTEKRPDCILMDCQMPVMDGYEATRQLRQYPSLRHLPIIALTANAIATEREQCRQAGMNDCLIKPVRSAELLRTLIKHLAPDATAPDTTDSPRDNVPDGNGKADFPPLPGIDIATGLHYANGKPENYRKIIRLFHDSHGQHFPANINRAFEAQNWTEATRYAHSFKSASRMIGATDLGTLAAELEAACKTEETIVAEEKREKTLSELRVVQAGLVAFLENDTR